MWIDGEVALVSPVPVGAAGRAARGPGRDTGLVSPLPGTVAQVRCAPGDAVAEGDVLLVVEAMKMEHPVLAPRDARVAAVLVAAGDQVASGEHLVELEALEGEP